MAAGKVLTGYSHPTVAKYSHASGVVTYSDGMRLARGVEIDVSVEVTGDQAFYADNALAEQDGGKFKSGKAKWTVDGLKNAARRMILGLPEATVVSYGDGKTTANMVGYGDGVSQPYLGGGFLMRYESDGVESYTVVILKKMKFAVPGIQGKTQEEQKDYQTEDLEATLFRDDSTERLWAWISEEEYETEAAALAVLDGILNVKAVSG